MATAILPLLSERLHSAYLARVVTRAGCWAWTGSKYGPGYGKLSFASGRHIAAHRYAFAKATGIEPGDLHVCHSCDNPECTNPKHLWLGTAMANSIDKRRKGRARTKGQAGEKNPRALLTEAQAREALAWRGTNTDLAAIFGVHHSTISAVRKRRTWAHL